MSQIKTINNNNDDDDDDDDDDDNDETKCPSKTEMVIFTCSFCLFRLDFSQFMCKASLTFSLKGKEA